MDLNTLLSPSALPLIIAGIVSLPIGLFFAYYISPSRVRALGVLGGLVGAIVAGVGLYFAIAASGMSFDTLSYFFGGFFICSTGVVAGTLLMDLLAGSRGNSGASPAH